MDKAIINELKSFLVERYVDNMSEKDMVQYIMDDLDRYYEKCQMQNFLMKQKTIGKIVLAK